MQRKRHRHRPSKDLCSYTSRDSNKDRYSDSNGNRDRDGDGDGDGDRDRDRDRDTAPAKTHLCSNNSVQIMRIP